MKTAMQELIELLEERINNYPLMSSAFLNAKLLAENLLEKEKQQIVAAWNSAHGGDAAFTGEEYYDLSLTDTTKEQRG